MIRAIIFDCFGVLYRGSLDYLYEVTPRERHGELRDVSRASDYGYLSYDEYFARLDDLTDIDSDKLADILKQHHVRNSRLFEVLPGLKQKYKLALLSNVGRGAMDKLIPESEQVELFETVVLSSEVNMIKPTTAIYQLTAEQLGLEPEECLMVDDMPRNIEGALNAGMQGVVFYNTDQLMGYIKQAETEAYA